MEAIEQFSPPHWSLVFTQYIAAHERGGPVIEQMAELAEARDATFVPVRLLCAVDELRRRASTIQRRERGKWVDGDAIASLASSLELFAPDHPNTLTLDVTGLAPTDAAAAVMDHARLRRLEP
jgi:hypothetical protein